MFISLKPDSCIQPAVTWRLNFMLSHRTASMDQAPEWHTRLFLSLLCALHGYRSRHASSPLREATQAPPSPSQNLKLEPAWLLCMLGRLTNCLSRWWFAQGERKMKELQPAKGRREKWRERLTTQKEVPWLNKCKPLNTTGRESQWHDNKHDCVYNN